MAKFFVSKILDHWVCSFIRGSQIIDYLYAIEHSKVSGLIKVLAFKHKIELSDLTVLSQELSLKGHPFQNRKIIYISPETTVKEFQLFEDLSLQSNHNINTQKSLIEEMGRRKKMLLHICCGPDAAGVIGQLKRDYDVHCFWYDPNIQPKEEHDKRLEAFIKVAKIEDVPYTVGEYDTQYFYQRIKGLEHTPEKGAKCSVCYDLRLERSAIEAKAQNCDLYSTTLAISPHKVQQKLKTFGVLFEKKYGVPYFAKNFMKDEGFKKSVQYTKEYNIYRQDYCGCYFSLYEGGQQAQQMAVDYKVTKDKMIPGYQNPFLIEPPPEAPSI